MTIGGISISIIESDSFVVMMHLLLLL